MKVFEVDYSATQDWKRSYKTMPNKLVHRAYTPLHLKKTIEFMRWEAFLESWRTIKNGGKLMQRKILCVILIFVLIPVSSFSASQSAYKSQYAGQEKRKIKSLSEFDIEELQNGRGWGLAKAAELNGVPGPAHLLEMKKEIRLNPEQIEKIELLYQEMKKQAIPLGLKLIELERKLNNHFADGTITDNLLRELLEQIAHVQKQLRYVHLSTHLKTPNILTAEQIDLYNKLRGYSSDDPCKNIPEGHDPEMWKRHHNCP